MTEYKVGGLNALFKVQDQDQNLQQLFKPRVEEKPKQAKSKARINKDESCVPDTKNREVESKSKKVKKVDSDDLANEEFSKPSRTFQVRNEDNKERKFDSEKEKRTIFIGNLPSTVTQKAIKRRFKEFGEVETVRFRGVARPDLKTTKKLAVIKRKFHEKRSNINAYIRFKDRECAVKSLSLNGSEFESNVIRVDLAMPDQTSETGKVAHDQSKSIFLGNLPFSIEENDVWNHFKICGDITDVRIIRDGTTGMGKGFGYVNFKAADSIELALRLNASKLDNREIRVTRSTNKPKQKIAQRVAIPKPKIGHSKPPQQIKTAKFVRKPKVDFQGRVGMKKRDIQTRQKKMKMHKKSGKKPRTDKTKK